MEAMCCMKPGLLNGPLTHRDTTYMVEGDGFLNPQPTPERFEQMRHFAALFTVRAISESRAAELDWPGWESDPDDSDSSPSLPPSVEAPAPAAPPPSENASVDPTTLKWNELRRLASELGVEGSTKKEILANWPTA